MDTDVSSVSTLVHLGANDCCAARGDGLGATGSEYVDTHENYSMTRSLTLLLDPKRLGMTMLLLHQVTPEIMCDNKTLISEDLIIGQGSQLTVTSSKITIGALQLTLISILLVAGPFGYFALYLGILLAIVGTAVVFLSLTEEQ